MPFEIMQQSLAALEPIFKPWEEPTRHRVPNPQSGGPAIIKPGRRPSKCPLVRTMRAALSHLQDDPEARAKCRAIRKVLGI